LQGGCIIAVEGDPVLFMYTGDLLMEQTQMALLENMFKGNLLTGLAVGLGALLLVPMVGPVLRPAVKAVIKGGMIAYQGLAEVGDIASDIVAEARAELEQQQGENEAPPAPSVGKGRPARGPSKAPASGRE